ncbi:MAG TPA: C1 family peptidase [Spirochaetota bacterium]|nr:C1 family peptidase [Spirochaetota bacterium]
MRYSYILLIFLLLSFGFVSSKDEIKGSGMELPPPKLEASFKTTSFATEGKLPSKVDLSPYLPEPGNQGMQGSCVAWATAYAYKSFHEKLERNWAFSDKTIFSPAYVYNQIHIDNSPTGGGSYIHEALELVKVQGVATLSKMPYDPNNYTRKPSEEARNEASLYKARGWERISASDIDGIKRILANGNAVIIGMNVYQNFYNYRGGIYTRAEGNYMGGHAMLAIGYDDSKAAFKIQNSWSKYWGENGYAWIAYNTFKEYVKYAYVMYDIIDSKPDKTPNPPSLVEASKGSFDGKIKIKWTQVEDAESYEVYRSLYKEGGTFEKIASVADTEYFDTNVEFKWYFYAIKTRNKNGVSILSSVDGGYPLKIVTKKDENKVEERIDKPGQVQNLRGVYSNGSILLFWDRVEGAEGYIINKFDMQTKDYLNIAKTGETRFSDNPKPGKYWYTVVAYNKSGVGQSSDSINVVVFDKEEKKIPDPPLRITASTGNFKDRIVISWSQSSDADFYIVKKWSLKKRVWEEIGKTQMLNFEDSGLSPNEFCYYYIVAGNSAGFSNPSKLILGYTSEYARLEIEGQKIEIDNLKTYKEKASELVQKLDDKAKIKAILPIKDGGKKILDEFYYTDNFIKESGYYKDVAYYSGDKVYKLQRFYTDSFVKNNGFNTRIINYDLSKNSIIRVETNYLDRPYISRISYYIEGKIFKTEVIMKKEMENSYGFSRMIIFHKENLMPEWIEFYDSNGIKVKEITKE